jgi:amino acid permease
MIPIVRELKDPTPRRKGLVAAGAMSIALTMFLVVGTAGYLTFGDAVDSDILLSYPASSAIVNVCRVGIIIDVLTSYPLLMFVTRISIKNLLEPALGAHGRRSEQAPQADEGSMGCAFWRNNFITAPMDFAATGIIVCFTMFVAISVSDLGIVAALTGATGATMIGYICPGFLYASLTRSRKDDKTGGGLAEALLDDLAVDLAVDLADDIEEFVPVAKLVAEPNTRTSARALLLLGCALVPAGVALTLTQ